MEKKVFEITMLGKDISIISDDLNYATLGKWDARRSPNE